MQKENNRLIAEFMNISQSAIDTFLEFQIQKAEKMNREKLINVLSGYSYKKIVELI